MQHILPEALSDRPRRREAVAAALAAFSQRPQEPASLCELAHRLRDVGELRAMFACAHDFPVLRGSDPDAMAALGTLLVESGFPGDGMQLLDRAHLAGAQGPRMLVAVARAFREFGRLPEAAAVYERCTRMAPRHAPAWLGLAECGGRTPDEDAALAAALRAVSGNGGEMPQDAAALHHALFRALDRLGDRDGAWAALEEGLRLGRAAGTSDAEAVEALYDHLAAATDVAPGESVASERVGASPTPVFIVGLHATGIAALGAMLASHPQIADLGDSRDFVQQLRWCADLGGPPMLDLALARAADSVDPGELGERYLTHVAWRARGKSATVDRTPGNLENVAHIARALPQARILHFASGPMDTCFAGLVAWDGASAPSSRDQAGMADHYRRYRRLAAHWRTRFPGRLLDVRHDELLADPASVLGEVLRFCGLDPEPAERFDAEAGPGSAGTAFDAPKYWRHYEAQLAPLKARLGALAY